MEVAVRIKYRSRRKMLFFCLPEFCCSRRKSLKRFAVQLLRSCDALFLLKHLLLFLFCSLLESRRLMMFPLS